MLDFCVGLDTEFSEIVEGSHLYYPKTKFDQVRQTDSTLCLCKCVLGTGVAMAESCVSSERGLLS